MKWLGTALRELAGLFVEDGSFAVAILAWLGIVWLLLRFGLPRDWARDWGRDWAGVALFAGLAVILIESAWRRARG
ncbi:MAG TPA: hypothetical protein VMA37_16580 [Acetobacteraceae bacterium]|nr:hypothetical protein [Acetobacteraceae bacterium]